MLVTVHAAKGDGGRVEVELELELDALVAELLEDVTVVEDEVGADGVSDGLGAADVPAEERPDVQAVATSATRSAISGTDRPLT